jgi:hypothetical protein
VKDRLKTRSKAEEHTQFHQLNDRKLLVIFNSTISEGLQLYSQIKSWIKCELDSLPPYSKPLMQEIIPACVHVTVSNPYFS